MNLFLDIITWIASGVAVYYSIKTILTHRDINKMLKEKDKNQW